MGSFLHPFADLISLEEAEDVLDSGVVGQALHPHQRSRLRQHRGGGSSVVVVVGGLGSHGCCHRSWRCCKVANGGRRNWRAGRGWKPDVRQMWHLFTGADELPTWGSTLCSSCSYTGEGGGGSRPGHEQSCALLSEEV